MQRARPFASYTPAATTMTSFCELNRRAGFSAAARAALRVVGVLEYASKCLRAEAMGACHLGCHNKVINLRQTLLHASALVRRACD